MIQHVVALVLSNNETAIAEKVERHENHESINKLGQITLVKI